MTHKFPAILPRVYSSYIICLHVRVCVSVSTRICNATHSMAT